MRLKREKRLTIKSNRGKTQVKILLLLPGFEFMENKATIGVIGAGTMGSGIAQVAVAAGYQTFLFDADTRMLEKAKSDLQNTFSKLVEKGKITATNAAGISSRIRYASSLNEFNGCGLIIEAIVENLEAKQNLFLGIRTQHPYLLSLHTHTQSLVRQWALVQLRQCQLYT